MHVHELFPLFIFLLFDKNSNCSGPSFNMSTISKLTFENENEGKITRAKKSDHFSHSIYIVNKSTPLSKTIENQYFFLKNLTNCLSEERSSGSLATKISKKKKIFLLGPIWFKCAVTNVFQMLVFVNIETDVQYFQ